MGCSGYTAIEFSQLGFGSIGIDISAEEISKAHSEKTEEMRVLKDLERIGRKQIVLATPVGYNEDPITLNGITLLEHISGWAPSEFENGGYVVRGMICPRFRAFWRTRFHSSFTIRTS